MREHDAAQTIAAGHMHRAQLQASGKAARPTRDTPSAIPPRRRGAPGRSNLWHSCMQGARQTHNLAWQALATDNRRSDPRHRQNKAPPCLPGVAGPTHQVGGKLHVLLYTGLALHLNSTTCHRDGTARQRGGGARHLSPPWRRRSKRRARTCCGRRAPAKAGYRQEAVCQAGLLVAALALLADVGRRQRIPASCSGKLVERLHAVRPFRCQRRPRGTRCHCACPPCAPHAAGGSTLQTSGHTNARAADGPVWADGLPKQWATLSHDIAVASWMEAVRATN